MGRRPSGTSLRGGRIGRIGVKRICSNGPLTGYEVTLIAIVGSIALILPHIMLSIWARGRRRGAHATYKALVIVLIGAVRMPSIVGLFLFSRTVNCTSARPSEIVIRQLRGSGNLAGRGCSDGHKTNQKVTLAESIMKRRLASVQIVTDRGVEEERG